MWRLPLLLLVLAAACKSTTKVPEGQINVVVHPEYRKFRPVVLAVLPVTTPRSELKEPLRDEIYSRLFSKRYSPLELRVVDAHTDAAGHFQAADLSWDATLQVVVQSFKPIPGTNSYAATGWAQMTYKTGETLWKMTFTNEAFKVDETAGSTHFEGAARRMGDLILQRLPDCPPLPR